MISLSLFMTFYVMAPTFDRAWNECGPHEKLLEFHALKQVGIFPPDPEFYREYNRFYLDHVRALDSESHLHRHLAGRAEVRAELDRLLEEVDL